MMGLLPLYLRREPTTEPLTRATIDKHARGPHKRYPFDVVAYRSESDMAAGKECGRWPWDRSFKPRYRCKSDPAAIRAPTSCRECSERAIGFWPSVRNAC